MSANYMGSMICSPYESLKWLPPGSKHADDLPPPEAYHLLRIPLLNP